MNLNFNLKCSCCDSIVFSRNITHNLNEMAIEAGIYKELWHPEEINCIYAKDIIIALREGLKKLKKNPDYDCGIYDDFLYFVEEVYEACKKYPKCRIIANR